MESKQSAYVYRMVPRGQATLRHGRLYCGVDRVAKYLDLTEVSRGLQVYPSETRRCGRQCLLQAGCGGGFCHLLGESPGPRSGPLW